MPVVRPTPAITTNTVDRTIEPSTAKFVKIETFVTVIELPETVICRQRPF
jgi:hypothetical protein